MLLAGDSDVPALRTDWPKFAWLGAIFIGGFHGLVISLPERLGGTREYLLHRSASHGQIFAAKIATGLGFALTAWAFPLALLSLATFSQPSVLSLPQVWLACGALGTSLISALGWGVFVGYLIDNRSRALTIWALGMCGLLALGLLQLWPTGAGSVGRATCFAAVHIAIGVLCILSASRAFKAPADPDLLPPTKSLALWLPALVLVLGVPVGVALPNLQAALRDSVLSDYPVLAVTEQGDLAMLDRHPDGGWRKLDGEGRVLDPMVQEQLAMNASAPGKWKAIFRPGLGLPRAKQGALQVAPSMRLLAQFFYTGVANLREVGSSDLWLDEESGELVLYHSRPRLVGDPVQVPWPEGLPDRHCVRLKKPSGAPFSAQTVCEVPIGMRLLDLPLFGGPLKQQEDGEVRPLLIMDPEDGSIFLGMPWEPNNVLVRAPLPNGDRMVDIARGLHPDTSKFGVPSRGPWIVRGSFGNYMLGEDGMQDVDPSEWIFPADVDPAYVVSIGGSDLLRPEVKVTSPTGELIFSGLFGPNTLIGYGAWVLNQLSVLLWPPALALRSYMMTGEALRVRSRPLVCEELVGSDRIDLLLGVVLFSTWLALRTRKELIAGGQSKVRCALWMSLHALCGPVAFVLYRLLEPKLALSTIGPVIGAEDAEKWKEGQTA